jgi:hypothetical protein
VSSVVLGVVVLGVVVVGVVVVGVEAIGPVVGDVGVVAVVGAGVVTGGVGVVDVPSTAPAGSELAGDAASSPQPTRRSAAITALQVVRRLIPPVSHPIGRLRRRGGRR